MLKVLLLIATFWLPSSFAALAPLWSCTLRTEMRGDGEFFLRYGRDSWTGRGLLRCQGNGMTQSRLVDVTYNGAGIGYGINQSSVVNLDIRMVTALRPEDFQFYGYVMNRKSLPDVGWRYESGGTLIDFAVTSEGAKDSLQQGNIFIR